MTRNNKTSRHGMVSGCRSERTGEKPRMAREVE